MHDDQEEDLKRLQEAPKRNFASVIRREVVLPHAIAPLLFLFGAIITRSKERKPSRCN